jgi:hypothetical protein
MPKRPNPFLEIGVTIVAPALVLMKLSGEARLGAAGALLLALAFPLVWGLLAWRRAQGFGVMAGIGVVSTMLTGGIGVLKLGPEWLAIKEAAVPAGFGLAVLVSAFTRKPLITLLVFNPAIFDTDKIHAELARRGNEPAFAQRLRRATFLLAATFGFSMVMNYLLARWLVTSPAGTEAFNEELGRMTLLSYPMIALPSMVMTMALLWWIARGVRELAGLRFDDILIGAQPEAAAGHAPPPAPPPSAKP